MSKHTIELDDRELYVVWAIITWFNRPLVTDKLKFKFAGMSYSPLRNKFEKLYDKRIEDRIIELGARLPAIQEDMKKRS